MSNLTLMINADASRAQSAFKSIATGLGKVAVSAKNAGTATATLDKFLASTRSAGASGKGLDELNASFSRLTDNVVEFGGTAEDAVRALERVKSSAGDSGNIALTTNALAKLVDESEDVEGAMANLDTAMKVAQKGMLKTEDAGSLMGRAMRGDTAILKELGGVSAKVAAEIDKIPDPAKRTALIMAEVKRVAEGTAGATTKLGRGISSLQTDIAGLNSKLAATGIPGLSVQNILIGIAGAALTAAVAIGSKLKGAVDAYTNSAKGNTAAVKEMEKQTKRLEITIGGLVSKTLELEQSQRITAARTESLNNALVSSDGKLSKVALAIGAVITPIVALTPGLNLVALGFVKATGAGIGLSAGLDKLLGTSKALSRQLRTELVASTRMAMRALASLQEMLPTGLNAAANEGAGVAAVGRIAKNLGRAAKGARRGGGGGGGGGAKKSEKDKLLDITGPAFDASRYGEDHLTTEQVMERARAAQEERRALAQREFAALNADLDKLQAIGRETVNILNNEAYAAAVMRTGDAINGVLQSATQSAYGLIDALAIGSLTLKDFGAASAVAGGDLIANLGMDIVSKAVGTFAQQLGSVFVGIGAGFEALASNPLALLGIGAGLVAAGVMLKRFGSSGAGGATSATARSADSSAANAVQALGRNLFAEQDREERTMNLIIGDYQGFRAMIRDTATTTGAGAPYLRGFA